MKTCPGSLGPSLRASHTWTQLCLTAVAPSAMWQGPYTPSLSWAPRLKNMAVAAEMPCFCRELA